MTIKIRKGFTLIELLVVIAIIGILSTLAVVALNNARTKSRDAKRVADVKQVQTALELYFGDKNAYPTIGADAALGTGSNLMICAGDTASGVVGALTDCDADANPGATVYMGQLPKDPQQPATPVADGSAKEYVIKTNASPYTKYAIWFELEADTGGLKAGSNCATATGVASVASFAACVVQ